MSGFAAGFFGQATKIMERKDQRRYEEEQAEKDFMRQQLQQSYKYLGETWLEKQKKTEEALNGAMGVVQGLSTFVGQDAALALWEQGEAENLFEVMSKRQQEGKLDPNFTKAVAEQALRVAPAGRDPKQVIAQAFKIISESPEDLNTPEGQRAAFFDFLHSTNPEVYEAGVPSSVRDAILAPPNLTPTRTDYGIEIDYGAVEEIDTAEYKRIRQEIQETSDALFQGGNLTAIVVDPKTQEPSRTFTSAEAAQAYREITLFGIQRYDELTRVEGMNVIPARAQVELEMLDMFSRIKSRFEAPKDPLARDIQQGTDLIMDSWNNSNG